MSKYKIEIEIDVDFQKFFDEIPEKTIDDNCDETYEIETIVEILKDVYLTSLESYLKNKKHKHFKYAKHHFLINKEISKQISKNYKITKL